MDHENLILKFIFGCVKLISEVGRLHPRPEVDCQGARTLVRIHFLGYIGHMADQG
jgi:hypothetical protein